MYLKNIILFFFVSLHFFQCQGSPSQEQLDSVEEIIADQVHQNEGIGIQKLKDVLLIIEESADSYQTFPTTVLDYIVYALKKTAYNRLFSIKDIKTYALAFAVSSDEDLMNFTESLVRLNRNGDGMGYRAFKTVIERIKQAKHIETPVPTYDDFEEACLVLSISQSQRLNTRLFS
ncbi:uncharacterized protein LOC126843643 [Adelges cooleyi]|uniref:uncharacterized protein LOC126843643 n=1 Tax=Adelges cooleyi TaxID=133065 RepID=UPI00217FCCC1|nr:uncharacterized protein LOC126843643 [Adelges cooleyi]